MSAGNFDDPIPFTYEHAKEIISLSIVTRMMTRSRRIDYSYDIPYLAGYSKDGSIIYLDRDLRRWTYNGRLVDSDQFLILHEEVEKALIDALHQADVERLYVLLQMLGMKGVGDRVYYHCHGVATAIEQHTVFLRHGESGLQSYNKFMASQVKRAEDERIRRVPADLDLTPYTSSEDAEDQKLLEVMKRRMT